MTGGNRTPTPPSAAQAHHPMCVSTGVFEDRRGSWGDLIAAASRVSTDAVELSALSEPELPALIAYLNQRARLRFRYVSVHAPVKDRKLDDAGSVGLLRKLPVWVRSIVVHPDALLEVDAYCELGGRLVLENMDDRKRTGRSADELEAVLDALPHAGFCLDVAHAHSIDPTMGIAQELLDRFGARLRQVHLSSLRGGQHVPLTEPDEELFAEVLNRCRDIPWICEAPPPERWLREWKPTRLAVIAAETTSGDE
jgi:Xylose isomerase-like TIM barrel